MTPPPTSPADSTKGNDSTLLGAQRGEGLSTQNVSAGDQADHRDEDRGQRQADRQLRPWRTPGDFDGPAADRPTEHHAAAGADDAGDEPEQAVLDNQQTPPQPGAGPKRAQDRRLVNASIFGHRDRAGEDQRPGEEDQSADHGDAERDAANER